MKKVLLSLTTISKGALPEMFDKAMVSVLQNIDDVNCERKTKREINIKVVLAPHETEDRFDYITQIKTKIAPHKQKAGLAYFGVEESSGEFVANEYDAGQEVLVFESPNNVHDMNTKKSDTTDEAKTS